MTYTIKNTAKQPLVFSLKDYTTLRLKIDGSESIKEEQMTGHIKTLESKGLVTVTRVEKSTKKVAKNTSTPSVEEKEEE